jgi:hypothetical protein
MEPIADLMERSQQAGKVGVESSAEAFAKESPDRRASRRIRPKDRAKGSGNARVREHWVDRLARLRLAQLRRKSLERPRQLPERKGMGRDLLEHQVDRLARLRLGQPGRQRLERLRHDSGGEGVSPSRAGGVDGGAGLGQAWVAKGLSTGLGGG